MITYSVAQVEALTGISAHSLRIWERRFDFIEPFRTDTNIRYYSDDQLKKLINVGILLRNDHKISKVVAMKDAEIHDLVSKIVLQPNSSSEEDIKALAVCMIEMNELKFIEIYNAYIQRHGLLKTFVSLIYPFLNHVGVLWGTNKAMPAQEHFISNLIRQKLIAATDALPLGDKDAPDLLLFLLDGEDHEIGLLLANYIAREMGWRTYYLGQDVPSDNLISVTAQLKPLAMFTMMISPRNAKFEIMLGELLETIGIPLLYSGNPTLLDPTAFDKKATYLNSPEAFIDHLKNLHP
ncbi:MAG: MerR family transcriptional regulator [Reichenbachiella sp.]|uniref:MerR family transcriptional regulator n=2 Tax=Reichenbachiella sp. TaxID=2184521 RepID=UPI003263EB3C